VTLHSAEIVLPFNLCATFRWSESVLCFFGIVGVLMSVCQATFAGFILHCRSNKKQQERDDGSEMWFVI